MKLTKAMQLYGSPAAKSADAGPLATNSSFRVLHSASPPWFPEPIQPPDGVTWTARIQRQDFSGISPIGVEAVNGEVHILLRSIDGYIMRINAATHLEVFTPEDQVRLHTWMAEQREREQ